MATWPNLQDTLQFEKAAASIVKSQRPHTISSAYERHNRPLITSHTFRPLQNSNDGSATVNSECCPDFPPEDYPDDCSEEATPTHKAYPPPLPLRAEEMEQIVPNIPPKPRILTHRVECKDIQAACRLDNNPIYVNTSDICSASTKSNDVNLQENSFKASFQKSLAATLAQNAVQQKLFKETASTVPEEGKEQTLGISSFQGSHAGTPVSDEGACGGRAPPPPVRRSSAARQPPMVPPHRTPKNSDSSSKEATSWNVFSETAEGADAHAQLMKALNARLDALQRDTDEEMTVPDRLPPPPPPLEEENLEVPPRQNFLSAPTKKLPLPPDKSSLLSDLESKLIRVERRGSKAESTSKFHTAPRPLETKAQRRVSQPTFSELLDQFPRSRNSAEEAPAKRLPQAPDRRSSLDLEHAKTHRGLLFQSEVITRSCNSGRNDAASRVQKWLAGRGSVDVSQCHADLLGEIREGVSLRKASSDDRSAPILRISRARQPK